MIEGRARKAARLALADGITLTAAAKAVGVNLSAVSRAWRALYPQENAVRRPCAIGRKLGRMVETATPEDEVSW